MRRQPFAQHRSGATLVECAVVYPAIFVVMLALLVGGVGVFRYQEVAHLAREGSRYASTHGGRYTQDGIATKSGVAAITSSADLLTYLKTKTVLLDSNNLDVQVSWTAGTKVNPTNYPIYVDTNPNLVPPGQVVIQNNVKVTVTYQWTPEWFLGGPITLTSTSQLAMSY